MTYKRFEDLPVWQDALLLAERVDDFTRATERGTLTFSQRDQIERASLSVSNNIAEGFERGSTAELLQFLYIARGSAGEVRSMLIFFERRPYVAHLKSEISNLKSLAEGISRQLRAWADHLQNSEIKGQRHLNKNSKRSYDNKNKAADFNKWLAEQKAALENKKPEES